MQHSKRRNAKANTKANKKITAAPGAPQPADDDPVPQNIDEFRNQLARRIHRFIGEHKGYWRGCPERVCRRARACLAPRIRCSNAPPPPPMTPEQQAAAIARVQRALKKRMAEIEGEAR